MVVLGTLHPSLYLGKACQLVGKQTQKTEKFDECDLRAIEQRLALVPRPAWQQALGRWVGANKQQEMDGFRIEDGEINYLSRSVFRDQPRRLMRVFLLMQRHSLNTGF